MEIVVGLVPGIILSILFIINDRKINKEKILNIIILLILGAIGSYICYRFEMHYGGYFKKVKNSTYLEVLFYAIFGVAIFEEGYKWFITLLVSFFSKRESSYDIVTYSLFASIGFLTFENVIYYVIPYGMGAAISRIFTSIPSHICFAIFMGYFLKKAIESKGKIKYLFYALGLIIPTLVHAFYNSFLYGRKFIRYFDISFVLIIILSIVLFVIMEYKRRKRNNNN